jgi:hypothetical protein
VQDPHGPDDELALGAAFTATNRGSPVSGSPYFVHVGTDGPDLWGELDFISVLRTLQATQMRL